MDQLRRKFNAFWTPMQNEEGLGRLWTPKSFGHPGQRRLHTANAQGDYETSMLRLRIHEQENNK